MIFKDKLIKKFKQKKKKSMLAMIKKILWNYVILHLVTMIKYKIKILLILLFNSQNLKQ